MKCIWGFRDLVLVGRRRLYWDALANSLLSFRIRAATLGHIIVLPCLCCNLGKLRKSNVIVFIMYAATPELL